MRTAPVRYRSCHHVPWAWWIGLACALVAPVPATGGPGIDELDAARTALRNELHSDLEELASWSGGQGLEAEAQAAGRLIRQYHPRQLRLVALSPARVASEPPAGASPSQVEWTERFWKLRKAHAEEHFKLARRAIRAGRASLAFELALETARLNPDHERVRKLLGYREYQGMWRTRYEVRRTRAGQVWHQRFGWLARGDVPRYEEGQRRYRGRWISAEDDAAIRTERGEPWEIETEHFVVATTHSIESGVRLGTQLEEFYRVWRQTFGGYYASDEQLARLFAGRTSQPIQSPRFRVVYFANREEYDEALDAYIPAGIRTEGIYIGERETAYFFANDERPDNVTNLYHEATHQLFSESRAMVPSNAEEANFWVIEGIACYMESLTRDGDEFRLGGPDTIRFSNAQFRLMEDDFYVPLAEFASYDRERFQTDSRLPMLYSQAAGLTHFLMHYDHGRYRDSLMRYLVAIYTGRDRPSSLAELSGTTFDALDRQYREFVSTAP